MGIWVDDSGRTILWSVPVAPENLRNVSGPLNPGQYVFGFDRFPVTDMPISSIYQRKFGGRAEEFIIALLSVLIIAVISDIVNSILMRRLKDKKSPVQGVETAFLVDEFYHLRNIWAYSFGKDSDDIADRQRRVFRSFGILSIGISLMALDVFVVYLVQPYTIRSSPKEYNLRSSQPVGMNRAVAQRIYNLSLVRTCVTPGSTLSPQIRQFTISACIMYNNTANRDGDGKIIQGETGRIQIGSWFHEAGSDHRVSFADHVFQIRQRGFIYINGKGTGRILFDTNDTAEFEIIRYLHQLFMFTSIEERCNGRTGVPPLKSCKEYVDDLELLSAEKTVREIELWRSSSGIVKQNVSGLSSTYEIGLNEAYSTLKAGLYPLTGSAIIEEVGGKGLYSNITSEEIQQEVEGLIVEEGRVAGLVTLSAILGSLLVIMLLMKIILKPVTFGEVASEGIFDNCNENESALNHDMTCRYGDIAVD